MCRTKQRMRKTLIQNSDSSSGFDTKFLFLVTYVYMYARTNILPVIYPQIVHPQYGVCTNTQVHYIYSSREKIYSVLMQIAELEVFWHKQYQCSTTFLVRSE